MDPGLSCCACGSPLEARDAICPRCKAPRPELGWTPDPRLGEVLPDGRTLRSRLGYGHTGSVYLAARDDGSAPVAVKVLRPELSDDPELARRFRLEAVLMRSMNIPQMVPAYEWGEFADGASFFTMEYVEGPGLDRVLVERGTLLLPTVLILARQVLAALDVAHSRGVVHRDLKPGNLLLTRDAQGAPLVRILDFGFARLLVDPSTSGPSRRLTMTRTILGTPTYMSPEQARGSLVVDGRSDLYSFGVILYRAIAGVPPFKGTQTEILHHHMDSRPLPPSAHWPDVPPALDRIILWMLEKDPARRPQTAGEVLARLDEEFPGDMGRMDPEYLRATATPRSELIRQVDRHVLGTKSLPAYRGEGQPLDPAGRKRLLIGVSMVAIVVVGAVLAWWLL